MRITKEQALALENLFNDIKLKRTPSSMKEDKECKVRQILSYLEHIDAQLGRLSKKRVLLLVDSGAGNCYLSFLVYHYYTVLQERPVVIHCIDRNSRLMDESAATAARLGFDGMNFHACGIEDFNAVKTADLAYSLHACDTATDAALFLGMKLEAKCILSVSCCQHSLNRQFTMKRVKSLGRYKAVKSRFLYLIADAMRAQILEMKGYRVDLLEFTSSRNTDKNLMIRARKGVGKAYSGLIDDYRMLKEDFNIAPALEGLLGEEGLKRTAGNFGSSSRESA